MMRKTLSVLCICCFLFACEDVIQLEVPSENPRLVIDASINWFKGSAGNEQSIHLSLTAPYFDLEIPPATGATVQLENSSGVRYDFIEEGSSGNYKTSSFIPILNETYTLFIDYKDERYEATETLLAVASIDYIEQKLDGGFDGKTTEIKAFYMDPAGEENYYLYEFESESALLPTFEVYDDEFTNGNQIFAFYADEDLDSGDSLGIYNYGISARFYEYMFVLLQQSLESDGGPFETQPAIVKGNCINLTNQINFPLGYFRLSQASYRNYVVQ